MITFLFPRTTTALLSFFMGLLAFLAILIMPSVHAKQLQYLGHPFSDIKRSWRADDYELALDSLIAIKEAQPQSLPKRRGEFSGPVYDRFIAQENFRYQLNIKEGVEQRRAESVRVSVALKEMMRVYFNFKEKKQTYGAEALGLMSYSLRQQAVFFTLTVEHWLTLAEHEAQHPDRLAELNSHKEGAAALLKSGFKYLALEGFFNQKDLEVYALELAHISPELYVHLTLADQLLILEQTKALGKNHSSEQIKETMQTLESNFNTLLDQHRKILKPTEE